jgi:YD repeat-containing protein
MDQADRVEASNQAIAASQRTVSLNDDFQPPTSRKDKNRAPTVKVTYDTHTDFLSVIMLEGVDVAESDEDSPGVILDYDEEGNLISIEILDASSRVTDPRKIEYRTTE